MRHRHMHGFSLVETSLALGVISILSVVGIGSLDFGSADLTVAQEELRGSIHQAFELARSRGKDVVVALGEPTSPDILPVRVSSRVHWGKPENVPVPPGMDEPKRAAKKGEAHARITVTPRHTATASAWFMHDGRNVLCMRLSGKGHLQMLRWCRRTGRWSLV